MSLLRLLAAGKSLVGLKESDSRYRLTNQRLLPQFGSKSNPFRTDGDAGQKLAITPALRAETLQPDAESPQTAVAPAQKGPPTQRPESKATLAIRQASHQLADWAGKYTSRLAGPFQSRSAKPAMPAIPALAKPMVQGELSLERVKVVRNDLSDSDLDIVRCRPQPSLANRSVPVAEPKAAEMPDKPWSRVTGRLFGAGKT